MDPSGKEKVISILSAAFRDNLSVNYTIGNGGDRERKIRHLISYSYKVTGLTGEILLAGNSAALITYSDKKASFLRQTALDIALVFRVIGIKRLGKILKRTNYIKKFHPKGNYIYLWLIGTDPSAAGKGEGRILLKRSWKRRKASKCRYTWKPPWKKTSLFTKKPGSSYTIRKP